MDYHDIYGRLSNIQLITDEGWSDFEQLFETRELSKNDYLISEGNRAYFCYFLLDGVIRVYYSSGICLAKSSLVGSTMGMAG